MDKRLAVCLLPARHNRRHFAFSGGRPKDAAFLARAVRAARVVVARRLRPLFTGPQTPGVRGPRQAAGGRRARGRRAGELHVLRAAARHERGPGRRPGRRADRLVGAAVAPEGHERRGAVHRRPAAGLRLPRGSRHGAGRRAGRAERVPAEDPLFAAARGHAAEGRARGPHRRHPQRARLPAAAAAVRAGARAWAPSPRAPRPCSGRTGAASRATAHRSSTRRPSAARRAPPSSAGSRPTTPRCCAA
jgi:hypothetical protein